MKQSTYSSLADVEAAAAKMRAYFADGTSLPLEHRRNALRQLKAYLKAHENRILDALQQDLGKSHFEGYATELGLVYDEINLCLKKMDSWARPRRVRSPIVHFRASSKVYASPYGIVLVLAPWNYPLQLALIPMIDALAAGNCVALKPSRTSLATSTLLCEIIEAVFPPEFVCAFPGSAAMNDWLLDVRWDHICFTGSPRVGHTIMTAAAKYLTPVTLELGGKSPCIVDKTANVKRAAQRIAWGKGINTGQTCVAPDYFLVHEDVADSLIKQLDACFHQYYGDTILACDEWPHIISKHHFDRVCGLIENHNPHAHIAFGGQSDETTLKIEPTCLTGVTLDDPLMKEEIFGPLLPVITYKTLDEAFAIVRHFEKPLATYLFSDDKAIQQRVIHELDFGGATINDVVIHIANNHMGFGGVGNSGMGAYHGKTGFDRFTHYKSTIKKGTWIELPVRNPPFKNKISLLRLLMR
ncbi:MAG: aldehyde dehydrogenase [Raoultibacter sp.]